MRSRSKVVQNNEPYSCYHHSVWAKRHNSTMVTYRLLFIQHSAFCISYFTVLPGRGVMENKRKRDFVLRNVKIITRLSPWKKQHDSRELVALEVVVHRGLIYPFVSSDFSPLAFSPFSTPLPFLYQLSLNQYNEHYLRALACIKDISPYSSRSELQWNKIVHSALLALFIFLSMYINHPRVCIYIVRRYRILRCCLSVWVPRGVTRIHNQKC